MSSIFQTNPYALQKLLDECHVGNLQLPDFQRSWVWNEDRIKGLIASVSKAYPIGALMALGTGGEVDFKPRPIEGAPETAKDRSPDYLLLDGQQRITSLYQVILRKQAVETATQKNKKAKLWFYLDMRKCLDISVDREEAIISVPENKIIKTDFGKKVVLDLSSEEKEYEQMMFPMNRIFDWTFWMLEFTKFWEKNDPNMRKIFDDFLAETLENFKSYQIPIITLNKSTSKEAVCVVFDKVNTGGKPLDAFELVTAMYAAKGHELRKDWYGDGNTEGRQQRFSKILCFPETEKGILSNVSNTDFLQAISLFYTRDQRLSALQKGKPSNELPAVSANRNTLLKLPLNAYKQYEKKVEDGFEKAAKFLHLQHIYQTNDLPYQSQVVPLAAILAEIGEEWEYDANRAKLMQWYWNGVFGELYSSAVDTRVARDFIEVPLWIRGGFIPSTINESSFNADRLSTMRTRLSAAYKGINALLMKKGAMDFRSGQKYDHTIFFGESVDIHHIFPKKWCVDKQIPPKHFDSIINKTPLARRTNHILGGEAPSLYLTRLEKGDQTRTPIDPHTLNTYLSSHLINHELLRKNNFDAFIEDRKNKFLDLIEEATGKTPYSGSEKEEGEDIEVDEDLQESERTLSVFQ